MIIYNIYTHNLLFFCCEVKKKEWNFQIGFNFFHSMMKIDDEDKDEGC